MTFQSTKDLVGGMKLDQINIPQSQVEGEEKKFLVAF